MPENDRDQPMAVRGLYMDRVPRASLEDEVVEGLRGRGALGRSNEAPRRWWLQAAAAVVLFLSGWGSAQVGQGVAEGPVADGVTSTGDGVEVALAEQYMLLLWEGPEFRVDESVAEEYGAWGRSVGERGVAVSGDELGPTRRLFGPTEMPGPAAASATGPRTGPPSEYRLGGYFMLGAGEEEVTELAETHPHRRYGGWVEIAPVVVR